MTTHLADHAQSWLDRGPSLPHPTGGFGSLIDTFIHAIAGSLGWHAGTAIAAALGPAALIGLAIIGVAVWLLSRRRTRR